MATIAIVLIILVLTVAFIVVMLRRHSRLKRGGSTIQLSEDQKKAETRVDALMREKISPDTIAKIRAHLAEGKTRGGTKDTDHIEHCFQQVVRFANLAAKGKPFRGVQWGLNFGRAQEIVYSEGGKDAWWGLAEPLINAKNWGALAEMGREWLRLLSLTQPTEEFVNRE